MSQQTEIEVKFLNTNHDQMRQKLQDAGATLAHPMRPMRRVVIDTPNDEDWEFIRVRDEGDRVTLTFKSFRRDQPISIDSAQEIETTVGDFQKALDILAAGGLHPRSYQESKRETWKLGDAEVVLDEWPWIQPYIEIEGDSEESVRRVAEKLGFSWDDAVFGSVDMIYRREYPALGERSVGATSEVRFGAPVPDMFLG